MLLSEIGDKEIIDLTKGSRHGALGDAEILFDPQTGSIKALMVPNFMEKSRFGSFHDHFQLPWEAIEKIGLDLSRDFYDNEHLNIYGQEKLTSYLGSYLATEVLDTPIVQSEENAKHWAECVSTLPLYRAYAYDMVAQGIERWIGEDAYELGRFEAWKKQS